MAKRPRKEKPDDAEAIDGEILPPEGEPEAESAAPPPPPPPEEPAEPSAPVEEPPGPSRLRQIAVGSLTLGFLVLFIAGWFLWPGIERRIGDVLAPDITVPDELPAETLADAVPETPPETVPEVQPVAPALPADARMDELATRIAALEERMASLEAALAAAPSAAGLAERVDALERGATTDAAARLDAQASRIAALEAEVAALHEMAAAVGAGDRLAALEAAADAAASLDSRVSLIEQSLARREDTRATALLAVGQLRAALRGSGAYEAELAAARAVIPADDETAGALDTLAAHAATGVATLETLRARFGAIADEIVRAAYASGEGSWLDQTMARLAGLATVRRVGEVEGDETDARVARAEARLAEDDLAAAVAEVAALEEAPSRVAADWLADARARLATDRALAVLDARALAVYAAPAGSG